MQHYEGHFSGIGLSFAIVVSRFNHTVSQNLLEGALDGLKRHGVHEDSITVVWVPGAFELPLVAKKLAQSNQFQAIICLGAIIRGETAHFEMVASQAASGILDASLSTNVPVIFSVLTTNTVEEALNRSGLKAGNNGFFGALTALEMANLFKGLPY